MNLKKVFKIMFTFVLAVVCSVVIAGTTAKAAEKSYTDNDLKYMAAIIYCEAGNQSYAGQLAVGCVVMNRVKSSNFPDTILSVIKQKGQFTPVSQGKFAREVSYVERGKYSYGARRKSLKAAQEVLEGQREVTYKGKTMSMENYHFFSVKLASAKLRIGGHQFR